MGTRTGTREMIIGWLMEPAGGHRASWMTFEGRPNPYTDIARFTEMAHEAEAAKLDYIFQADWPSVAPGPPERAARNSGYNTWLEPMTLVAALAAVTSKIGIVATGSTTYNEPYNLARAFASLDHISHGRAGWNIVTSRSPEAAWNYGRTAEVPHAERYRRGEEFVDVVLGLWDSYEDDAVVRDNAGGWFVDPAKVHKLNYKSDEFSVRGPLNVSRVPQGHPVLFQAGSSGPGMDLGARVAEVIFCIHGTLDLMDNFYRSMREKAAEFGRSPDDLRICSGIEVIVKESAAEAEDAFGALDAMLHPEAIKDKISNDIEADISDLGLDDYVTVDRLPKEANSSKSADALIRGWLEEKPMTVRELFERFGRSRGVQRVCGDPREVADRMEEWFTVGVTDGFMLFLPLPTGMTDFTSLVVPELQRRGLFRREYTGNTLREHLGLERPTFKNPSARTRTEASLSRT